MPIPKCNSVPPPTDNPAGGSAPFHLSDISCSGVGKSALLHRYADDIFNTRYTATVRLTSPSHPIYVHTADSPLTARWLQCGFQVQKGRHRWRATQPAHMGYRRAREVQKYHQRCMRSAAAPTRVFSSTTTTCLLSTTTTMRAQHHHNNVCSAAPHVAATTRSICC